MALGNVFRDVYRERKSVSRGGKRAGGPHGGGGPFTIGDKTSLLTLFSLIVDTGGGPGRAGAVESPTRPTLCRQPFCTVLLPRVAFGPHNNPSYL